MYLKHWIAMCFLWSQDIKGNDVDLSIYKGKVLLIVNVASQWYCAPFYSTVWWCKLFSLFSFCSFFLSGFYGVHLKNNSTCIVGGADWLPASHFHSWCSVMAWYFAPDIQKVSTALIILVMSISVWWNWYNIFWLPDMFLWSFDLHMQWILLYRYWFSIAISSWRS
jgi:hypothetical protein